MTSIERLHISGIRSFDPNPANRQTVVFQKPLTVILGKNGAGKTTIIEALLNACTGAMPPGSGTEKGSFVYDPKVLREDEVKAQIRLIFTGKGGKVMQVIRSFQASRSRNKITFTTLDNTVAYLNSETGEVVSNTYRSSDVDRVVPEMLGVSPAVLQHVIFCHQEDCNWPLAPPKDVKNIFDDIFAATRYVMALERLRENSKEYRRQQKEHEASLLALREHRDQAKQLKEDIETKEKSVYAIQNRNKSIEPELQELRDAAAALKAAEREIETLERESAMITGRMEERKESIQRTGLQSIPQSLENMLEIKRTFVASVKEAETLVDRKTKEIEALEQTQARQKEESYKLRSDLYMMEKEAMQHKQNCAVLQQALASHSSEFVVTENSVDTKNLERIMQDARRNVQTCRDAVDAASNASTTTLSDEQENYHRLKRQMEAGEKEEDIIQKIVHSVKARLADNKRAKDALGGDECEAKLRRLATEIASIESQISAAEEIREKGGRRQLREKLIAEIDALNSRIAQIRQDMAKQKQFSGGEEELAHLRAQADQCDDKLQKTIAEDVLPQLQPLLVEIDATANLPTIVAKVSSGLQVSKDQLQQVTLEISNLVREGAVLEQKQSFLSDEITAKETLMHVQKKEVHAVAGTHDLGMYKQKIHEAREKVKKLNEKRHSIQVLASCYHEFSAAAEATNKCSVCDRPFHGSDELQHFVEMQKEKSSQSPEAARLADVAAQEAQQELAALEKVEKLVLDIAQTTEKLPEMKKNLTVLLQSLEHNKALLSDAASRRESIQSRVERQQNLQCFLTSHVRKLQVEAEQSRQLLSRREQQIKAVQAELGHDGGNAQRKTYEELEDEHEKSQALLLRLHAQLSEAQRQEEGGTDRQLSNQLTAKRDERHRLELQLVRIKELEATMETDAKDLHERQERLKALAVAKAEDRKKLASLEATVEASRRASAEQFAQARKKAEEAEAQLRQLDEIVPKVLAHLRDQRQTKLEKLRQEVARLDGASTKATSELEGLRTDLGAARRTVDDQHRRGAEIERTIHVLEQRRSLEADEARLKEIQQKLKALKGSKFENMDRLLGDGASNESLYRLQELIGAKLTSLEKVRAQQEGNVEAIQLDIHQLKNQLEREKYQNIEKRYRSTFLKLQTTEIAVKDIDRYYSALEQAVQSYHQEKIAQINEIIAELWRQTYRGSDIDTVEIHSETEATTTTSARRNYNYRVVMRRGNSEIDMRGRCSAGQKVLASVIIRLALSEAFCFECGILALDEPTTNLDEDNARSLAESLRALIEIRRSVKHFQLIVITHDEQFVRALGGQSLDRFYYVHKDREGAFSVIDERTFDQLFA